MKRLLRLELKKALKNRFFVLSVSIMTLFAVLSAVYMYQNNSAVLYGIVGERFAENGKLIDNPMLSLLGFYNAWVGGENLSLAYSVFYTLLPVAAALPYAWSFFLERKTGYLKNIATRVHKTRYITAKMLATFLSGTLTALIPLLVNVVLVSATLPVFQPEVNYVVYTHIGFGDLWADLYYTAPLLYLTLFVLLTALFCGLFALLSFAVSFYIHNRVALLFTPFLLFLGLQYVENSIASQTSAWSVEAVPMSFLHTTAPLLLADGRVIFGEAALFLLFSVGTILLRGRYDEIY